MEPTAAQLAARLNPTPVNISVPTNTGFFKDPGGFGAQIFKLDPTTGQVTSYDTMELGRQAILKNWQDAHPGENPQDQYGSYKAYNGLNGGSFGSSAVDVLKNQYGIDYGALPTYNLGDLYSNFGRGSGSVKPTTNPDGGITNFTLNGNLADLIKSAPPVTGQTQTINNTPNAVATPAQIATQQANPAYNAGAGKQLPDTGVTSTGIPLVNGNPVAPNNPVAPGSIVPQAQQTVPGQQPLASATGTPANPLPQLPGIQTPPGATPVQQNQQAQPNTPNAPTTAPGTQAPAYTGNSIVDYLGSTGQPSDFSSRTAMATKLGIVNYTGSAEQNTQLLNTLRQQSQLSQGAQPQGGGAPVPATVGAPTATAPAQAPGTASYINANGAYFQQTPAGLQVVNDPTVLKSLQSGQIPSTPQGLGTQKITGLTAPQLTPQPANTLGELSQNNPALASTITGALGATSANHGQLDQALSQLAQNPLEFVSQVYSQIYKQAGLTDIKSSYETYIKNVETITNERDDKIADINEDPWMSQGVKDGHIKNITNRYASKIDSATNTAKYLQDLYNQGLDQAQFITGQTMAVYNNQVNFQDQIYLKKMDEAASLTETKAKLDAQGPNTTIVEANGRKYLINSQTGAKIADIGSAPSTSTGTGTTGTVSTVTGKPLTDAERKAQGYAQRLVASDAIITKLGGQFSSPTAFGALLPNQMQSPERQQYEQAKTDFVNAVLRPESGAAISPSEFAKAEKQYFPQAGDSQTVIAQKATNRQLKIQAMQLEGGQATSNTNTPNSTTTGSYQDYLKAIGI